MFYAVDCPRGNGCFVYISNVSLEGEMTARDRVEQDGELIEFLHQITITISEWGLPVSCFHMNGYESHIYSLISPGDKRYWVKFHFKNPKGSKNLTVEEAELLVSRDRKSHQRDLLESIDNKDNSKWDMKIQIMEEEDTI